MKTVAIYNEINPYAAQWLHSLSDAGMIALGKVVSTPVQELNPDDITTPQFHAFAGIGIWSYALRRAGVPDDANVWTGSCPCQPWSSAGRGGGAEDPRHLWPAWFRLIREHRPAVIFGEQVASPSGRAWLDAVSADLEALGYAVGSADLCAASVGAPHIRQRLFFVAYADGERREDVRVLSREAQERRIEADIPEASGSRCAHRVGNTDGGRLGGLRREEPVAEDQGRDEANSNDATTAGYTRGFWYPPEWVGCADGKTRPLEPGTQPMVDGNPELVEQLRAYGNAIVGELAAEFASVALSVL